MKKLILLRHGQSEWNLENRFTGWTDVELSPKGREEARQAGELIAAAGLKPRYCFTSYLRRAIQTLDIALDAMDRLWLPVVKDWHLNERHYGALQGLNKADTAAKYGDEQVHIWRRSYDVAPPALAADDERFPGSEERYAFLGKDSLPLTESLADTVERVRPCWEELIAPALGLYDTVFVAAHGNSLRALIMMLLKKTPDEIVAEEIPTGVPRVLELTDRLEVVSDRYLSDKV
ncbi:2,3-diphosphoglycerate-dependent phosphoglycerate mutase [uncultured Duncaniella sp.]|uniref:2,3-diphosphoglycerate-dependent phosphoglycerate mutase n=1 Tax=uncultured Duncaniella sp. TaxID=2768039 RepID=UPI0026013428|nr:2,3-diphosphoglycerate-dependent phosphoglycerate mutase [uncultured Duncaniella sp.]